MRKIEHAVLVLEENLATISSVSEWAEHLSYSSEKYFSRVFRDHYGKRPSLVLQQVKLKGIREYMANNPDDIFYSVARELGFANDQALYKFVKRHTGKSLTELKKECQKGVSKIYNSIKNRLMLSAVTITLINDRNGKYEKAI